MDEKRIELQTSNPQPLGKGYFGVNMPRHLTQESIDIVIANIELQRKGMNQGFDNLIELIRLNSKALLAKPVEADAPESQQS